MAWDQDLPDGDLDIAQGDDDIRTNNAALETALDAEHRFTTGGNQSGTHTFNVDTTANVAALSNSDTGRIAFSDDEIAGQYVLQVYAAGAWNNADINPGNVPRTDEINVFDNPNWSEVYDATGDIVAGSPDTLEVPLDQAPVITATLAGDTLIDGMGATGDQSGDVTTIILELVQPGGGGVTVTWDSPTTFVAPYGAAPIVDEGASARTICQLTKTSTGVWVVTTLPDVSGF